MSNGHEVPFKPLVTSATTSQSPNVGSLMDDLEDGKLVIPDYQRDSSQWDTPKKSLFIESMINNLTVPPLTLYPEDDASGREVRYVIDGQQRLTTIREYLNDNFDLSREEDVEYADNVGPIIQGHKFSKLPTKIQRQIRTYTVNLIVLPKNLDLSLRLEVFRRINEGGVPLSAHDLRLATFGESDRVWLIRLAGVFDPNREGSRRMIAAGQTKYGLDYPWKDYVPWCAWWNDSRQSSGQAASEMFLYYVIAKDLQGLETLRGSSKAQQALGLKYDESTASVLDLYCAQLQRESRDLRAPQMLARLDTLKSWFAAYELWFSGLKKSGMSMPLNSSRKIAFFIAAAANVWSHPSDISDGQWERIQLFLKEGPKKIQEALGVDYPIVKGRWPAQKRQIEKTDEICKIIKGQ